MRGSIRTGLQWIYTLTPVIISIFVGLSYQLYAQQREILVSKADKIVVDKLCDEIKDKVDNKTLLLMIESLKISDTHLIEKVNKTEEAMTERIKTEKEQLQVLTQIQAEIKNMNSKIERVTK